MVAPSAQRIAELFAPLATGDAAAFYGNVVADNVDWTVMGTHPLAGRYLSKASFLTSRLLQSARRWTDPCV